jgi:hypothetical protein
MPLALRLDPRPINYESAIQVEEDDGPDADVDPYVEATDWVPITPEPRALPDAVAFVDGVQRVEMRVIGDENGRMVYGALASVSVGAVFHTEGRARTESRLPDRVLALSDGGSGPASLAVECGPTKLHFEVTNSSTTGLAGVIDALNSARGGAETRLGTQLLDAGYPLVIMDGRLNFDWPRTSVAVVGLVKTMQKQYLDGAQLHVLSQIGCGQRTPLFRIARDRPVYSWYTRLANSRPFDHPWTGLVRLETPDSAGIHATVQLADVISQHLPRFASNSAWDARAPQNLYPVAALESLLRHELGDHEWIRRHIEVHFHRQGVAV